MLLYCLELGGDQKVTLMLSALPLQMTLQCSVSASLLPSYVMTSHDGTLVTPSVPPTAKIIEHDITCMPIYVRMCMYRHG